MKNFVKIYAVVLVVTELFLTLGGYALFDFRHRFFLAGAICALILAIFIFTLYSQSCKIEELEKRLQALEGAENSEQ